PEFRERLKRLRLNAERLRTHSPLGPRKVQKLGAGLEFAGHRAYSPGDDLRYLDWNALGRLEQLALKVFDAPNEISVVIAFDPSATLWVGSPSKAEHLQEVAAALGYLALANGDRAILAPTSAKAFRSFNSLNQEFELLSEIESFSPKSRQKVDAWLAALAKVRGDTLVVLLTDFQSNESTRALIQGCLHHRARVLVIHDWLIEELSPQLEGNYLLEAIDGKGEQTSHRLEVTSTLLDEYRQEVETWRGALQHFCQRLGVAHLETKVDESMESIALTLVASGIVRVKHA
ncbi:MAG: DUF58 domain-containing protein, partial [Planctomycetes bacterium]|nr:DUF58 domain-containing protein [Planctomycetota bacterium]